MIADNIEFAADLEPDVIACDRFEQFVELVRLIRQMAHKLLRKFHSQSLFSTNIFSQPKDKRMEMHKQNSAYQIEHSTKNNVNAKRSKSNQ